MGKAGTGIHYNTKRIGNGGVPQGEMNSHLGATEGFAEEIATIPVIIAMIMVVVSSYWVCVLYSSQDFY